MTREQLATQITDRQESLLHALKDIEKRAAAMRDDANGNFIPRYSLAAYAVRVDELATEIKTLSQVLLATPK
jgi:hypothetical protein